MVRLSLLLMSMGAALAAPIADGLAGQQADISPDVSTSNINTDGSFDGCAAWSEGSPPSDGSLHLATALDSNFFGSQLTTWLNAVSKHGGPSVTLYLLADGLQPEQTDLLQWIIDDKFSNIHLKVFNVTGTLPNYTEVGQAAHVSRVTQARLNLPYLQDFVGCQDRMMWIDVDAIPLQSLRLIWEAPLDSSCGVAAAGDNKTTQWTRANLQKIIGMLHTDDMDKMKDICPDVKQCIAGLENSGAFNAGVMLMSLNRLRASNLKLVVQKLVDPFGANDQIALNVHCNGWQNVLPARYNVFRSDVALAIPQSSWVILHNAGAPKPWQPYACGQNKTSWTENPGCALMQARWLEQIYPMEKAVAVTANAANTKIQMLAPEAPSTLPQAWEWDALPRPQDHHEPLCNGNDESHTPSSCEIAYFITSSPKFYSRLDDVYGSWLKGACNYMLIGDKGKEPHPSIETYGADCPVGRKGLCCKTVAGVEQSLDKYPSAKWIMKLDDDTMVVEPRLQQLLGQCSSSRSHLVGGPLFYRPPPYFDPTKTNWANLEAWQSPMRKGIGVGVRGGAGYVLSRPFAEAIREHKEAYMTYCEGLGWNEDVTMSYTAHKLDADIHQVPGFLFHSPEIASRRDEVLITSHFMHNTSTMVQEHEHDMSAMNEPSEKDLLCYAARYPNVAVAYGNDTVALSRHWKNHGMKEGRNVRCSEQASGQELEDTELLASAGDASILNRPSAGQHTRLCASRLNVLQSKLYDCFEPKLRAGTEALLVNFPNHTNRGDAAIFMGEMKMINDAGIKIIAIAASDEDYFPDTFDKLWTVPKEKRLLLLHGGGNFGDLYPKHHRLRLRALKDYPDITAVMFPQTVNYGDPTDLEKDLRKLVNRKVSVHLTVRDRPSYNMMNAALAKIADTSKIKVTLTPDAAFALGDLSSSTQFETANMAKPSMDILMHLRTDNEASDEVSMDTVRTELSTPTGFIRTTKAALASQGGAMLRHNGRTWTEDGLVFVQGLVEDWLLADADYPPGAPYMQQADARTKDALKYLTRARVVITNRLHSHILMTLMARPHVVIDDRYGKVSGVSAAWLDQDCRYGVSAETLNGAMVRALEVL